MSRLHDHGYPLALRASQAAAMLGISESLLRTWVAEGLIHKPYHVRKSVVLFDVTTLANDWDRLKLQAELGYDAKTTSELPEKAVNPWDALLKE